MELAAYARDSIASELIEAGNYKQVLKNLDKRLKKSADNVEILGLKAGMLLLLGDQEGSRAICRRLIDRKPPIVNHAHLELLFFNLCELRRADVEIEDQEIEAMWQNAIKAEQNSNNRAKLARTWASQSILHGYWQQYIKASMIMQRQVDSMSQDSQHYWFCQVAARYMTSRKTSNNRMSTVHRELVVKMLEKAASETPDKAEPTIKWSPSIKTSRELKMFSEILSREGKYDFVATTLETPGMLKIAGNDYFFDLKTGDSLIKLGDAFRVWNWAKKTLENAKTKNQFWLLDDWRVWSSLIEISRPYECEDMSSADRHLITSAISASENLLNECISMQEYSRAPQRALFFLRFQTRLQPTSIRVEQDGLVPIAEASKMLHLCRNHFERYFEEPSIFDDIKYRATTLNTSEFLWLRNHMESSMEKEGLPGPTDEEKSQLKWLIFETNQLSLDHEFLQQNLRESHHERQPALLSLIQKFIISSIGLYRVSKKHGARFNATDTKPGDDSCIMSAEALRLLNSEFDVKGTLFQAACILQSLITHSGSNFKARTEQVKLLSDLGLQTAAWESYKNLDVKEIMCEALSPLVFARIASTEPYASKSFDARREMERPLGFYEKALSKIHIYEELALDSQNYAHAIHIEDLALRVRNSPTRWILGLERRRIARFRGLQYDRLDASFDPLKCPENLNFDHLSSICRGYAEAKFGRNGCKSYTTYLCYIDLISEALDGPMAAQRANHVISALLDTAFQQRMLKDAALEKSELDLVSLLGELASLVAMLENSPSCSDELSEKVNELAKAMDSCWQDNEIHDWKRHFPHHILPPHKFFNSCYNTLQFLQLCQKAASKITGLATAKGSRDRAHSKTLCLESARQIKDVARTTCKEIRETVQEVRAQIPLKQGTIEFLLGSETDEDSRAIRRAVLDLVGNTEAEDLLLSYCETSRTALDGILRIVVE